MSFKTRRISEGSSRRGVWGKLIVALGMRLWKPLVHRFTIAQKRREEEEDKNRRLALLKKIAVILAGVFAVLLIFGAIVKGLIALRIVQLDNFLSIAGTELARDEHGFTNVLLLGAGDKDHDGVNLTDSIMVASIDPSRTRSIAMLSITRDLYVLKSDKMGAGRINSLYRDYRYVLERQGMEKSAASQEALRQLGREIGTMLGVTIHHVVKADFTGFVRAIDAVGGVDVDVSEDIVDTLYPGPNYTYDTFSIRAGPQHLDGETALKYVRSRHTTSDFGRSARQQQVLSSLRQKAEKEGWARDPGKILELLSILAEHVETTMSFREMVGGAALGRKIDQRNILAMQLNDRAALDSSIAEPGGVLYAPPRDEFEGASVLLPISFPPEPVTWRQIHTLVDVFMRKRELLLPRLPIAVLNASAKTGLAGKLGNELTRYGFDVQKTANAAIKQDASVISGPEEPPVARELSNILQIPYVEAPATATGITIVLGKSFTYTPIQLLLPAPVRP